jgi:hypothetical protein
MVLTDDLNHIKDYFGSMNLKWNVEISFYCFPSEHFLRLFLLW